jgi:hypothetical protein
MTNTIKITKCDNQLILLALTEDTSSSYEICDIKSGCGNIVDLTINIDEGKYDGPIQFDISTPNKRLDKTSRVNLPKGNYILVYAGVNCGGPYNFHFSLNGTVSSLPNNEEKPLFGVIWSKGDNSLKFSV